MPQSSIRVDRDRLVYGAILDFTVDGISTGATQGEATVRRAVEYFDIQIEQANGTIAKSIINDQRFLELTLAEANLDNIRRAWDGPSLSVKQSFTGFDVTPAEVLPWGLAADNIRIYMVGDTQNGLYTIDNLGKATRVKASNAVTPPTGFGLATPELLPTGLSFVGDTLYMVGDTTQFLYTLDPDTGIATRVGETAAGFGSSEMTPRGLASDGTTLWMVGESTTDLYTLDTSTGAATQVGSATTFGTSGANVENMPRGLAHDGTQLYMLGAATKALYTLNTTTGIATRVGAATNFGLSTPTASLNPTGLTWFNNGLWMTVQDTTSGATNGRIYKLDKDTGIATAVGDLEGYTLDNPDNNELEHRIELVAPGSDGRYRRYTFFRAVSISEGEHMIQKDGLTMVPLSFEILNDPLKTDGAQFGTVEDIPALTDTAF